MNFEYVPSQTYKMLSDPYMHNNNSNNIWLEILLQVGNG